MTTPGFQRETGSTSIHHANEKKSTNACEPTDALRKCNECKQCWASTNKNVKEGYLNITMFIYCVHPKHFLDSICFLVSTSLGPTWPTEYDNRDFFNTLSVASFEFSSSLLWDITCHSGVWYMWLCIISTFCRSFYFFHILSCIIISLPFSSCMKLRCTGKPLSSISPLMHYFPLASQKAWLLTILFLDYSAC